MSLWGIQLEDSTLFNEVREEFYFQYDQGFKVKNISKELIEENQVAINDIFYAHQFWFALALSQWETGELSPALFRKVRSIILRGKDRSLYRYQEFWVIEERETALKVFLKKISSENKRPRARSTDPLMVELRELHKIHGLLR